VVYIGSGEGTVYAFRATTSCGTCLPLWTYLTGGATRTSPTISDGVVYMGSEDDKVYAFALP